MDIFALEITSGIESKSVEFKFVNKKNSSMVHKTIKTQFRFDVKSFQ